MSTSEAYIIASRICQRIVDAGPHVVNWQHDINRVIPELETVEDTTSIYGYRSFWDGQHVRFVFSTFYSYPQVREAVVRAGLTIIQEFPSTHSGPHYRHSILLRADTDENQR